jgi:two-component system response regulator LytT
MNIRVMIAEDERLAREELIYLLSKESDVTLLPSATNGRELLELASKHEPDVVFLDIEMPEMDGVQAAQQLAADPHAPCVVFTTAYDSYAVEAFRLEAVDYLLKPYDPSRLREALARVRKRLNDRSVEPPHAEPAGSRRTGDTRPLKRPGKLLVDEGHKMSVVDEETILYLEKEEKTTKIVTSGKQYFSRATLQELEEKLSPDLFFRSHRSYLVNLNFIEEIEPWFNGAYSILLKNKSGTRIPVSRESAKQLLRLLRGM